MSTCDPYKQRALEATAKAYDGAIAAYEGTIARQSMAIFALQEQLAACLAGPTPPPAVIEGDWDQEGLDDGIAWLGGLLGRPLVAGERARLHVLPRAYAPLLLGGEGHGWWARGTLEVASYGGPSSIVSPSPTSEAISVQSSTPTEGTCALELRDIALRGAVHISCPGGLSLRLLGSSLATSVPRPTGPPVPL